MEPWQICKKKYEVILLLIALKNRIFEFVDIVIKFPALRGLSVRHEDTKETACIWNELGVPPQGYDSAEVILLQLPYVIRGGRNPCQRRQRINEIIPESESGDMHSSIILERYVYSYR
jgi:hypothetical protein